MVKAAYYNGIVYTGELPLCRAFIVENGRFLKTGTEELKFTKKNVIVLIITAVIGIAMVLLWLATRKK